MRKTPKDYSIPRGIFQVGLALQLGYFGWCLLMRQSQPPSGDNNPLILESFLNSRTVLMLQGPELHRAKKRGDSIVTQKTNVHTSIHKVYKRKSILQAHSNPKLLIPLKSYW